MKKNIFILIILLIVLTILCIIFLNSNFILNNNTIKNDDKIHITTTLFPQYDFVRQIGKEKVEVSLILPFGTESHSYDPTPDDIISINNSDLLIYTGDEMEPWASKIISSLNSSVDILNVSSNITLHNEHEHHDKELHDNNHTHELDPHIWMNPENACIMIENILQKLISLDPENQNFYTTNAKNYIEEIKKINEDFNTIYANKKIVFGSPFSYSYFVDKYNLEFITVYDSCSETIEPSLIKVKSVIDQMNEDNIKYILCEPLSSNMVAQTISYETNAKILPFYSIHNISKKDFENGQTYLSLMKQNLESIKLAIQ